MVYLDILKLTFIVVNRIEYTLHFIVPGGKIVFDQYWLLLQQQHHHLQQQQPQQHQQQ